jgi:hypothetical protein
MKREKTPYAPFKSRLQTRRVSGVPDRRDARRTTVYRIQAASVLVKIG